MSEEYIFARYCRECGLALKAEQRADEPYGYDYQTGQPRYMYFKECPQRAIGSFHSKFAEIRKERTPSV